MTFLDDYHKIQQQINISSHKLKEAMYHIVTGGYHDSG